jgi:hypothetical protein
MLQRRWLRGNGERIAVERAGMVLVKAVGGARYELRY